MHYLTYVMIPSTGNIEGQVAQALAPFDENRTVEPYHRYLKAYEVEAMAKHYGRRPEETAALADLMPNWRGEASGVDAHGLLYSISQFNPDGKWDWYEIGGRWNGILPGNIAIASCLAKKLAAKQLPYSLLTPEGLWLDHEALHIDDRGEFSVERKPTRQWRREIRDVFRQCPDHRVVAVDCHR